MLALLQRTLMPFVQLYTLDDSESFRLPAAVACLFRSIITRNEDPQRAGQDLEARRRRPGRLAVGGDMMPAARCNAERPRTKRAHAFRGAALAGDHRVHDGSDARKAIDFNGIKVEPAVVYRRILDGDESAKVIAVGHRELNSFETDELTVVGYLRVEGPHVLDGPEQARDDRKEAEALLIANLLQSR